MDAYHQLVEKIDSFAAKVHTERAADMRCAPGCSACCHAELTVCETEAAEVARGLEALPDDLLARIAERALAEPAPGGPCVLLEEDRCTVYAHRPLVCRTQGLALAYPPDFIPAAAVRAKDARGHDVAWCPLNFESTPPAPAEVLDAGRVDEMLALIDRLAAGSGESGPRVSLRELARRELMARR